MASPYLDLRQTELSIIEILEDGSDGESYVTQNLSVSVSLNPTQRIVRERMSDGQVLTKVLNGERIGVFAFEVTQSSSFYNFLKRLYYQGSSFIVAMKGYKEATIQGVDQQDEIYMQECFVSDIANLFKANNEASTNGNFIQIKVDGIISKLISNGKDMTEFWGLLKGN